MRDGCEMQGNLIEKARWSSPHLELFEGQCTGNGRGCQI